MEIKIDKINYRRVNIDDIGLLIEYRIRFLNEFCNNPEEDKSEMMIKELQDYFYEAISSNDFIAWLAEYNGKIIGTGGMVVWQIPARFGGLESGKRGYILNMYTIPDARRKGISTRLLYELINEAKSLGLTDLHLRASENRINIYRNVGFVEPELIELKMTLE